MKQLSIKFSDEEWQTHLWLQEFLGIKDTYGADATTVKTAETIAQNVLLNLFGKNLFRIFKRKHNIEKVIQAQKKPPEPQESNTLNPPLNQ